MIIYKMMKLKQLKNNKNKTQKNKQMTMILLDDMINDKQFIPVEKPKQKIDLIYSSLEYNLC